MYLFFNISPLPKTNLLSYNGNFELILIILNPQLDKISNNNIIIGELI